MAQLASASDCYLSCNLEAVSSTLTEGVIFWPPFFFVQADNTNAPFFFCISHYIAAAAVGSLPRPANAPTEKAES